jgi:hypothetical protein
MTMILHFPDEIDGEDKTFEVYSTEKGTVVAAVYAGTLTLKQVEEEGKPVESIVSLKLEGWAELLAAVRVEADK